MRTTDLLTLIESALRQMEQSGASAFTLKNYRETGFGAFRREFKRNGQMYYSPEAIEKVVEGVRRAYERCEISCGKWKIIRRGAELLKSFHSCGSLDLPPCERWDVTHNRLHDEPSPEELADTDNVYSLVWRVKQALTGSELSVKTRSNYQYDGFDKILRAHMENGAAHYSPALTAGCVEQSRRDCSDGVKSKSCFNALCRTVELLNEYRETGELRSVSYQRSDVRDNLDAAENLNIRELMELALIKLKETEMRPKTITAYRVSGFGSIVRYCEQIAQPQYSVDNINGYVEQARAKFESGKISECTWRLILRGGELLKHLHDTGSICLTPIVEVERDKNPLHREPTEQELANPNSVMFLVYRAQKLLEEQNLTSKTLASYRHDGFDRILAKHFEQGLTDFSPELSNSIVEDAHAAYKSRTMGRSVYQNIRKADYILAKIHATGKYDHSFLQRYGLRQLSNPYNALLESFCAYARRTEMVKESTVHQIRSSIRGFLLELEDAGIASLEGVPLRVVSERITHYARRFAGGLGAMLFGVRIFLRFLHKSGVTAIDLSISIPELIAPHKTVREGFSPDIIDKLLAATDTTTSVGKRDYAIMLLAKQTGLRACDVTNLTRENIDWRTNEIRIVQVKTGVALTLPLPIESGNAIAEYVLNFRPKCDLPYIFLSKDNPRRRLKSVGSIIRRYINKADVADIVPDRSGFHSFRRAYGKQLLEAETSLDLLGELLGQLDMDSAKPYIAADEQGLKRCALGLVTLKKAGVSI